LEKKGSYKDQLQKHFKEINQKINEIQFKTKEESFDKSAYRLVFRKILDGYDP